MEPARKIHIEVAAACLVLEVLPISVRFQHDSLSRQPRVMFDH